MCYKVSTPDKDQLEGYFQKEEVNQGQIFTIDEYPHYFHADGFTRPFLPITSGDSPRAVKQARWKLLPRLVKNEAEAVKYANTLNARCEDVFNLYSYRDYIEIDRCLVWVNGFFEPNHPTPKETIPYYVTMQNKEPFTLGGLYADWKNKDTGETYRTFSIITTPPNDLLREIHNEGQRMPLVITPQERDTWIGKLSKPEIIDMMKPLPDGILQGYPVSGLVYKRGVDNNVPEAIAPL